METGKEIESMNQSVPVLDKGYVRYLGSLKHFGIDGPDEIQVVNAARVSYDKEIAVLGKRDIGLINFLIRESHSSPFRHSVLAYEVRAPLFVARQWWKYAVGSAHLVEADATIWNESSRRYVTEDPEFYIPTVWRSAPDDKKQGSGGDITDKIENQFLTDNLKKIIGEGVFEYESAVQDGVAPEMARLFLPAYGMYVRWRWTASLLAVLHFLNERLGHGAQKEMQDYAKAVRKLTEPDFPISFKMLD